MMDQIKKIMRTFSVTRTQHEALVAVDFNLVDKKTGLMRLCFSAIANWPLAIIFCALYFNPFRYQNSVHNLFSADSQILIWAFSENFMIGFILFALLQSVLRFEMIWLTLIAWLISNGDIHVFIATGAMGGVFFASARRNLRLIPILQPKIKLMWTYFSILQVLSVFISVAINYLIYKNLKFSGFFSATMSANRFEFFTLAIFVHHAVLFLITSVWGHFYSRRQFDSSDLKAPSLTAEILNQLDLSTQFKAELGKVSP